MEIRQGKKTVTYEEICEATKGKYDVLEITICVSQLVDEMKEGIHHFIRHPGKLELLLTREGCQLINDKGIVEAYRVEIMKDGAAKLFA